jgi:hypothetical protein
MDSGTVEFGSVLAFSSASGREVFNFSHVIDHPFPLNLSGQGKGLLTLLLVVILAVGFRLRAIIFCYLSSPGQFFKSKLFQLLL